MRRRKRKKIIKRITKRFRRHKMQPVVNFVIFFVAVGFVGVGAGIIWAASLKLPDFDAFSERKVLQSSKIYDRTGEILLFG